MQRALAPIHQDGEVLGDPRAPVTVYEFADLQCPFCGAYMQTLFPKLLASDVAPGRVKMVLQPIALLGNESRRAAIAASAAAAQNKMWNFADAFFYNQRQENTGYVTDGFVREIGSQVPGLRVSRMMLDLTSEATHDRLRAIRAFAVSQGVVATPTFLVVGRTRQATVVVGTSKLEETIDRALAASKRKSVTLESVG
jgi:protein-disulfide isomerase